MADNAKAKRKIESREEIKVEWGTDGVECSWRDVLY